METSILLSGLDKAQSDIVAFSTKIDKSLSKLKSFGATSRKIRGYARMAGTAAAIFGASGLTSFVSGFGKPEKDAGIAEAIGNNVAGMAGMIGGAVLGSVLGPIGAAVGAMVGQFIGSWIGGAIGKGVDDHILNPTSGSRFKTLGGDFYRGVDPKFYDQENSKRPNYSLEDQIANRSLDFEDARAAQLAKTMALLHQELRQ